MNPVKKIGYDENSEPPKNYIGVKNYTFYQFDKYLRKWVEYKNKDKDEDEDNEEPDLIKFGELFSGYIITAEEFESGSYLSKYKSIHDRLNEYNETYGFENRLVDGVYIMPCDLDDDYKPLSYIVLPFEIFGITSQSSFDLYFHMVSEKSIEKYLNTSAEDTPAYRDFLDTIFYNKLFASINVIYDGEENTCIAGIDDIRLEIVDGLHNLYINHAVINLYKGFGSKELFINDSGDIFIFFDLPDNIATVDNAEKLQTALNELFTIYE